MANCPNCNWRLPFVGVQYREEINQPFDCPNCGTKLRYNPGTRPLRQARGIAGALIAAAAYLIVKALGLPNIAIFALAGPAMVAMILLLRRESLEVSSHNQDIGRDEP